MSSPSMFETKRTRCAAWPGRERAQAIAGPEVRAADADVHHGADPLAGRAGPGARAHPARRSPPSGRAPRGRPATTLWPSTSITASRGARSAMCSTGRPSVTLIRSPANIASRAGDAPARSASAAAGRGLAGDPVLRVVEVQVAHVHHQLLARGRGRPRRVRAGARRGPAAAWRRSAAHSLVRAIMPRPRRAGPRTSAAARRPGGSEVGSPAPAASRAAPLDPLAEALRRRPQGELGVGAQRRAPRRPRRTARPRARAPRDPRAARRSPRSSFASAAADAGEVEAHRRRPPLGLGGVGQGREPGGKLVEDPLAGALLALAALPHVHHAATPSAAAASP